MNKWIQHSAAAISMSTMVLSPVAQGAYAKQSFNENVSIYLKQTGLTTKKMTVGQYWKMVRHVYPKDIQTKMDQWVAKNGKMMMPKITASSFKDGDNKNFVRLVLSQGKESHTLTISEDESRKLTLDNVTYSEKELLRQKGVLEKADEQINKKGSAKVDKRVMTTREIARLPLKKQLDYLLKLRQASEAAEAVLEKKRGVKGAQVDFPVGEKYAAALSILFGNTAIAAKTWADGNSCIAGGWVATYKNGSCARPKEGRESLLQAINGLPFSDDIKSQSSRCAKGGGLPCNPILFGFAEDSMVHCVAKANVKYATRECNQTFPLKTNADKEKIIQSIVKANGGKSLCRIDEDGKTVPKDCMGDLGSYIQDLKGHYKNAAEFCTVKGDASTVSEKSWVTRSDLREDQTDACENLKDRYFDLMVKEGEIPGPGPGEDNVVLPEPSKEDCKKQNKNLDPVTEKCVCPDGQFDPEKPEVCFPVAEPVDDVKTPTTPNKQEPGWWDRNKNWIVPVGIGMLGLGLFWWMNKKMDSGSNVYTPPAPSPYPDSGVCNSGQVLVNGVCTTPVVTPPVNNCPSPNQMVNGVCTPPVIVTPPTVPSEGSSGTTNDGSAGGTR